MQTQQKALAAFAVTGLLSKDEELLQQAISMLRYNLSTHLSSAKYLRDGQPWGHTWISVLGLERMMHGIDAIRAYLLPADIHDLRTVICSETEWLWQHYEIVAGEVEGNKPESNLWNGAFLHRAAMAYPEHQHAKLWQEKVTRFLINSISLASDKHSDLCYDGIAVKDAFVGGNFFPNSCTQSP